VAGETLQKEMFHLLAAGYWLLVAGCWLLLVLGGCCCSLQ
jgi:hypothetical protein